MWQQRAIDHHSWVYVCGSHGLNFQVSGVLPYKGKTEWQPDSWELWGSQAWPGGSLGGKGRGGASVWFRAVKEAEADFKLSPEALGETC